jgi:hypothetical protein
MAVNETVVARDRLLTNSAAEFLEHRAESTLGTEIASFPAEFVPELDRFVAQEDVVRYEWAVGGYIGGRSLTDTPLIRPDYFEESNRRLIQFKQTLASFQQLLVERKLDQRYGIEIKASGDYTFGDVLSIAHTIQKAHAEAEEVRSCMGLIRKVFRSSGRNASTMATFLEFVPNDMFGSVICGGFTVILSVYFQHFPVVLIHGLIPVCRHSSIWRH